jgi:hypothetical protein
MEVKKYKLKVNNTTPYPEYKHHCVYKMKVKDIDLTTVKPQRAGIILYTKINDVLYFGLGVDNITKEYTDFGGGISYKPHGDKNVIEGALREFNEETLNIFDLNYNDVQDCLAMYNTNNLVIFKYVEQNINLIKNTFLNTYNKIKNNMIPEVCDIVWLSQNEFKNQIMIRGNMFHRLQCFLQKADHFYWLL